MDLFLPEGQLVKKNILEGSEVVGSLCVRCWYNKCEQLAFRFLLPPSTDQGNGNRGWTVDASVIWSTRDLPTTISNPSVQPTKIKLDHLA
jgi:hypothetical protein